MHENLEDKLAAALPAHCFAASNTTGELIIIKRGVSGFYPTEGYTTNDMFPTFADVANLLNERNGVTKAQRMAMEMGSMFGWDCPGADPKRHETSALIEDLDSVSKDLGDAAREMRQNGVDDADIRERFERIFQQAKAARIADGVPV